MASTARRTRSTPATARRRRKYRPISHKKSMLLITAVLLCLVVVLGFHSLSIRERGRVLAQQEEELLRQIQVQEERALEIADFEEFVHSDEHIRMIAGDVLNLVEPNAIIFRPVD